MTSTRRTWLRLASACSLTWLGLGCSRSDSPTVRSQTDVPAGPSSPTAPAAGPAATQANAVTPRLIAADWAAVQQQIGSHAGRIVVLDLWSTYCPPCLKELPGLARLKDQFGDAVACLTLNCDFTGDDPLESLEPRILKYVRQAGVESLDGHLVSTVPDQDLYAQIGIAAIPVVRVFDRTGKQVKQFDNERQEYAPGGFTYAEHIVPLVAELIRGHG